MTAIVDLNFIKKRIYEMRKTMSCYNEVAAFLGVSPSYLSRFLGNHKRPNRKMLAAMEIEIVFCYRPKLPKE
jgi:transcriptional regulator with XRE-family HTH domain